jgi:hypothetical protein
MDQMELLWMWFSQLGCDHSQWRIWWRRLKIDGGNFNRERKANIVRHECFGWFVLSKRTRHFPAEFLLGEFLFCSVVSIFFMYFFAIYLEQDTLECEIIEKDEAFWIVRRVFAASYWAIGFCQQIFRSWPLKQTG